LLTGRVAGLLAIALSLALAYFLLLAADRRPDRALAIGLMLAVTACTAVAIGSALGVLVRREQDGALALFLVAGLQFIADPPTLLAHLLPFWSTRELSTWAVDGPESAAPATALAHAAATVVACALIASAARKDAR
jgi:drug/metabolite transporter (DMT)-like permease